MPVKSSSCRIRIRNEMTKMNEPTSFLAYTPRGPGLMCAVMSIVAGNDVYGWYTGSASGEFPAAFFMLEHYYSTHETAFYRSVEDDVYGDWVLAYPPLAIDTGRSPPVPEPMCHELMRAQDAFIAEWLFYADDPAAAEEVEWYHEHELALGSVAIRHARLNRLDHRDVVWTYASPALDLNIIDLLRERWPLDYSL